MKQQKIDPRTFVDSLRIPDSRGQECQVLSELMMAPENIPFARGIIKSWMFSDKNMAQVWQVLNEMSNNGETIDPGTISSKVSHETIVELMNPTLGNGAGSAMSVTSHCTALAQVATRRKIFVSALSLIQKSSDNSSDFGELISMPGSIVEDLQGDGQFGGHTQKISDVLNDVADHVQQVQEKREKGVLSKVPSGFQLLDRVTLGGFDEGQLVILSARPSVGKTAIMLQMAKTASMGKIPAMIFSLEMTNRQLGQRLLFSTEMVKPSQIANGNVDWENLEMANKSFDGLPLLLNDTAKTLDDISAQIMLNHQQGKCDIAFIDYLDLITLPESRYQTTTQETAKKTARLKQVAKECRIPIVLLCQLNRNNESLNRSPELIDLRNSGSIEQDADIVLMLERESKVINDPHVNMWVRKNRNGQAGNICVKLEGNDSFTAFNGY